MCFFLRCECRECGAVNASYCGTEWMNKNINSSRLTVRRVLLWLWLLLFRPFPPILCPFLYVRLFVLRSFLLCMGIFCIDLCAFFWFSFALWTLTCARFIILFFVCLCFAFCFYSMLVLMNSFFVALTFMRQRSVPPCVMMYVPMVESVKKLARCAGLLFTVVLCCVCLCACSLF